MTTQQMRVLEKFRLLKVKGTIWPYTCVDFS